MNQYIVASLALVALASLTEATPLFFAAPAAWSPLAITSTLTAAETAALATANTAGASAATTAISAVAASNLVAGVLLLKALAVKGLLVAGHLENQRKQRSVEDEEAEAILQLLMA